MYIYHHNCLNDALPASQPGRNQTRKQGTSQTTQTKDRNNADENHTQHQKKRDKDKQGNRSQSQSHADAKDGKSQVEVLRRRHAIHIRPTVHVPHTTQTKHAQKNTKSTVQQRQRNVHVQEQVLHRNHDAVNHARVQEIHLRSQPRTLRKHTHLEHGHRLSSSQQNNEHKRR